MHYVLFTDVCECGSNSRDLQQSSVVDICIGTLGSPCRCNSSSCEVSCARTIYTVAYIDNGFCNSVMKDILAMDHCVQETLTVIHFLM